MERIVVASSSSGCGEQMTTIWSAWWSVRSTQFGRVATAQTRTGVEDHMVGLGLGLVEEFAEAHFAEVAVGDVRDAVLAKRPIDGCVVQVGRRAAHFERCGHRRHDLGSFDLGDVRRDRERKRALGTECEVSSPDRSRMRRTRPIASAV